MMSVTGANPACCANEERLSAKFTFTQKSYTSSRDFCFMDESQGLAFLR